MLLSLSLNQTHQHKDPIKMKKKVAISGIIILVIAVICIWKYVQDKPEFVIYGFQDDYNKSYFLFYGCSEGSYLKHIEGRYYVRLKQVKDFGISRVRDNIPTKEFIHYFLDLNNEVSIYRKDQFPNNGIHYFEDTKLDIRDVEGLISFYIGDTLNTINYRRHASVRDSLIQSLE